MEQQRKSVWRGCEPATARRAGLGVCGSCNTQERARSPAPTPVRSAWMGLKGGEAACVALYDAAHGGAQPRTQPIGCWQSQGTMGLRFARSDRRPTSESRRAGGPSLADVATCAAKAASVVGRAISLVAAPRSSHVWFAQLLWRAGAEKKSRRSGP